MTKFLSICLVGALVVGSGYLFLQSKAPEKFSPSPLSIKTPENPIEMLFVGDIMLDRTVRSTIERNGFNYVFNDIKVIFQNLDLAVGNLEGTVTSNQSLSLKNLKILKFTFPTSSPQNLKSLGFSGFSLANNHALDFGTDGLKETQNRLTAAGLFYFGTPSNDASLSKSVSIKGQNVCFVGFHSLYNPDTTSVVNGIKSIKEQCNFTVVFAHWGEEYIDEENEAQENAGHDFIDAGADLVIGAHPHVVEPIEIYKNKAIFYSLGNFIFDQDFSLATRQGVTVRVTLSEKEVKYHLIPIAMSRSHLYFPEKEFFQERMSVLISKLPKDLAQAVDIDSVFTLKRD